MWLSITDPVAQRHRPGGFVLSVHGALQLHTVVGNSATSKPRFIYLGSRNCREWRHAEGLTEGSAWVGGVPYGLSRVVGSPETSDDLKVRNSDRREYNWNAPLALAAPLASSQLVHHHHHHRRRRNSDNVENSRRDCTDTYRAQSAMIITTRCVRLTCCRALSLVAASALRPTWPTDSPWRRVLRHDVGAVNFFFVFFSFDFLFGGRHQR